MIMDIFHIKNLFCSILEICILQFLFLPPLGLYSQPHGIIQMCFLHNIDLQISEDNLLASPSHQLHHTQAF